MTVVHLVISSIKLTGSSCFMPGLCSWKSHTNRTLNSYVKQCISSGLGEWKPHSIDCMTIPLAYIWTCRVHTHIHTHTRARTHTHTHIYIYIYIHKYIHIYYTRMNVCCIYNIYKIIYSKCTFLYNILIYFWCNKNVRLTSIGFGMVHSDSSAVVVL